MSIFGQNANKVVGDYSAEFESRFLEHCARSCVPLVLPFCLCAPDSLRGRHRNTRVPAQLVYNEYIADKEHIHMNGASHSRNCFLSALADTHPLRCAQPRDGPR